MLSQREQLLLLELGDPNPLPALTRPLQCGKDQPQTTPLVEEAGDDLGAPALLQEAALNQIRGPHVPAVIDRDSVIQPRLHPHLQAEAGA